ncbi:MAG: [protein-PII] uridylyltransferase [Gammaproteobacteria bacterium]|nr:[protein-PII] uridylyltransferase [Gammaproteobacteria bacterium]
MPVNSPAPDPASNAAGVAALDYTLENNLGLNWDAIEADLDQPQANIIRHWRQVMRAAGASQEQQFRANAPIERLIQQRAELVDRLITRAWQRCGLASETGLALVAVGGYGRGELHPGSDIDLLILSRSEASKEPEQIAGFLTLLWDLGLEIGHSTRTIAECRVACKDDLTTATTLMESRLLRGAEDLYEAMRTATAPPDIWPSRAFFEAKLKEQQDRHHRYDDTAYNLEPNIKGSPGGLRDLQIIMWVTRRHFGSNDLGSLVERGFVTPAQLRLITEARKFLWRLRFALHTLTGRREDRLLFDYQTRIAALFGYEDAAYTLAVEQLMQRYYRTAMDISRINEMLLQLFQEEILMNPAAPALPINENFAVKNGFLQLTDDDVFHRHPSALLEIFLILQQHPELKGVSANTIALVRRHLYLIDDEFRVNPRHHRMFLQILEAREGVTHELRRMNSYGVLGQYIPAFGRIVGRMQYDLFHAYTVDAHTLFVVSNLRRFALSRFDHEYPQASEVMRSLDKPVIAYLSGLFHDIAKGRGGDHSELGAVSAETFCLEHGMSGYDAKLVAWLVRHHLLLSTTAQKKDINDPAVIAEFAGIVGDETHLDYLYVLTMADVRGTNPKLWNSWKAQLFTETHKLTRRALRQGLENPVEKAELLSARAEAALALLEAKGRAGSDLVTRWNTFGEAYLLSCTPAEIAWHTRLLRQRNPEPGDTLVDIQPQHSLAGTAVLIYAPQVQFTFAIATAVIDELGLSVTDARIVPLDNDYSLSFYTILEGDGQPIEDPERRQKIARRLDRAVRASEDSSKLVTRKAPRQVRMFSTAARVQFTRDNARSRTVMEITAGDRPGLAAEIGRVLRAENLFVRMAKLVTVGERAEDVFYITNAEGAPLSSGAEEKLRTALLHAIDDSDDNPTAP